MINKDTQSTVPTILLKAVHEDLKKIAKYNKRSVSSEIALLIEQHIKECKSNESIKQGAGLK